MAAAVGAARRILLRCSTSSNGGFHPRAALSAFASARVSRRLLPSSISRLPVELRLMQSLLPFHSATASALLTSKLSLKPGSWAWLSEGFATPL